MKKLACQDLGLDCSFKATAETNDGVKKKLWTHAEKTHPMVTQGITVEKKKAMMSKMDVLLKRHVASKVSTK